MNEENRKKREWVKSAAIVFLTVMLILTFFSNTIMNYSLPEVATQRIQSGSITAKIRGTGTVESGDPYNVEVKESRKVAGVAVKAGDQVEEGDVILYLEDEESAELMEAEKALKTMEDELDQQLLQGLDANLLNKVQSGNVTSVDEYLKQINALKAGVDAAQKEVDKQKQSLDEATKWVGALTTQIGISSQVTENTAKEQKALNDANTQLENAKLRKQNADVDLALADAALALSPGDAAAQAAKDKALKDQEQAGNDIITWEREVNVRTQALNNAQLKVDNAKAESEKVVANLNAQLETAKWNQSVVQTELDKATAVLTEKTEEYTKLVDEVIPAEMNLANKIEAINEQREVVAKLRSESVGATVTASVAGTITSVSVVAGQSTTPGTPVAVIQPEGKGFTLSFSVTNEQAKRVKVGDPAELVNGWWYNEVAAKVSAIKPDPSNPGKQKLLTFDLTGDLTAGQNLTLSVGQNSSNYDMIVPNSALREDNNGKFILIVEQKASPLGNRFKATRVDVQVLASDDTQSAISGGVYGYEDVITTSTKPIEAGQLIRLPD